MQFYSFYCEELANFWDLLNTPSFNVIKRTAHIMSFIVKSFKKITGIERRKKKKARQIQVIRQQKEQTQIVLITLQTEEEVPEVASPSELSECPTGQHEWKSITNAVIVESNGTTVSVNGQMCVNCLRMQ